MANDKKSAQTPPEPTSSPEEATQTATVTRSGNQQQKPLPQEPLSEWDLDDIQDALDGGQMEFVEQQPVSLEDTLTQENIEKYVEGEATWAQLMGMTMEEAYGVATFGFQLYEEGKYQEAKNVFEALVLANPYDAYFHATLGAIYQQLDMRHEALIEYDLAIEQNEEALNAYVNRAELLLQDGNFEKALADLERAIALDPKAQQAAGQRAHALAQATAQALELLPKAREKLKELEAQQNKGGSQSNN